MVSSVLSLTFHLRGLSSLCCCPSARSSRTIWYRHCGGRKAPGKNFDLHEIAIIVCSCPISIDNPFPKFRSGRKKKLSQVRNNCTALESLITTLAEWPLPPLPAQRSKLAASYVRSPRECLQIKPVHREVSRQAA